MSPPLLATAVLARYPAALNPVACHFLGNHGGFSGARLWKITSAAGPLCLRAWPNNIPHHRIVAVHRWMTTARDHGLAFAPAVLAANDGDTCVRHAERLWDLTTWLPGRADFHEGPNRVRLAAAFHALARLHLAWVGGASIGVCPAVLRRLERAAEWTALLRTGWRPSFGKGAFDPVDRWAERAWIALQGRVEHVAARLAFWIDRQVPLQVCHADVWHAHVLFDGEAVSGIIDYGSARVDHVAVDLSRLLGSLVEEDTELRAFGLQAYRQVRPMSVEEVELTERLDETGTILAAANWLRWLYHDAERRFDDRLAVAGRLEVLVRRLEAGRRPGESIAKAT